MIFDLHRHTITHPASAFHYMKPVKGAKNGAIQT